MNLTLQDIEIAIRRNFILKQDATMLLQTESDWEAYSDQTARVVFVGVAADRGFSMDEVCEYLDISVKQYLNKVGKYKDWLRVGKGKVEVLKRKGKPLHLLLDKGSMADSLDLRIYRKTMLVNNCLATILQQKSIEFRKTLPNYIH